MKERGAGDFHSLEVEYVRIDDCEWPAINPDRVLAAGSALVADVGGFQSEARHAQELKMRDSQPARVFSESQGWIFQSVANRAMGAFRIGIFPPFGAIAHGEVRKRPFPHQRKDNI